MKKVTLVLYTSLLASTTLWAQVPVDCVDCQNKLNQLSNSSVDKVSSETEAIVKKIYDDAQTEKLFAAIQAKNISEVKAALANNANPNGVQKVKPWFSAAALAVRSGTVEILRAILDTEGADPNVQSETTQLTTPIMIAAKDNKVAFIDALLDKKYKTNINQGAAGGRTALNMAATNHNHGAIERLVREKNINLNSWSFAVVGGGTALGASCVYGDMEAINVLFAHNPEAVPFTKTNLDKALSRVNPEIAADAKVAFDAYKEKYKDKIK